MNTKQLWNALTLNPVTNNYFDGIFSIDTLKDIKEKPTLIVCNTDPSDKVGEHWILFFFHDNTVDFYDSLGHDITYYGSEFIYFVKSLLIILSILSDEPNLLKPMYVDIIVCIMLLKNVKVILWKILLIIFLLKMIL